jgi:hypothetical protein
LQIFFISEHVLVQLSIFFLELLHHHALNDIVRFDNTS